MASIRSTTYYSGRVQGVGFRWQTLRIVSTLPVTGFCRNLRDGRVEVVLEGAPDDVQQALSRVESQLHHYISRSDRASTEATGEFTSFEIRP